MHTWYLIYERGTFANQWGKAGKNLKMVGGQIAQLYGTQNKRDQIPNSNYPKRQF